jgi:hypothetical protein
MRCKPGYRFLLRAGGGKSGQQRTTHRLMAGPDFGREESATENNLVAYFISFGKYFKPKG